jgi:hypothetical protein
VFDVVFVYSRKSPHPCHCAYVYQREAIFEKLETGEKQTFKVKYIDGFDSARFHF